MTSSCCADTRQRAEQARERVAAILAPLGLQLHPDKTRIVSLAHGREGFDFLGFHHRLVESWKWRGRYYLNKWPSARAMASIRGKVRERTDRRYASADLGVVVGYLNPVLRGWGNYFRHGNSNRKFHAVDSYVPNGWPGWPASSTGSEEPTGTAGSTTVAPDPRRPPAHRNRRPTGCACLTMNDVGEPDEGEPQVRFDRGPLATATATTRPARNPRASAGYRTAHHRQASGLPHHGSTGGRWKRSSPGGALRFPGRCAENATTTAWAGTTLPNKLPPRQRSTLPDTRLLAFCARSGRALAPITGHSEPRHRAGHGRRRDACYRPVRGTGGAGTPPSMM